MNNRERNRRTKQILATMRAKSVNMEGGRPSAILDQARRRPLSPQVTPGGGATRSCREGGSCTLPAWDRHVDAGDHWRHWGISGDTPGAGAWRLEADSRWEKARDDCDHYVQSLEVCPVPLYVPDLPQISSKAPFPLVPHGVDSSHPPPTSTSAVGGGNRMQLFRGAAEAPRR